MHWPELGSATPQRAVQSASKKRRGRRSAPELRVHDRPLASAAHSLFGGGTIPRTLSATSIRSAFSTMRGMFSDNHWRSIGLSRSATVSSSDRTGAGSATAGATAAAAGDAETTVTDGADGWGMLTGAAAIDGKTSVVFTGCAVTTTAGITSTAGTGFGSTGSTAATGADPGEAESGGIIDFDDAANPAASAPKADAAAAVLSIAAASKPASLVSPISPVSSGASASDASGIPLAAVTAGAPGNTGCITGDIIGAIVATGIASTALFGVCAMGLGIAGDGGATDGAAAAGTAWASAGLARASDVSTLGDCGTASLRGATCGATDCANDAAAGWAAGAGIAAITSYRDSSAGSGSAAMGAAGASGAGVIVPGVIVACVCGADLSTDAPNGGDSGAGAAFCPNFGPLHWNGSALACAGVSTAGAPKPPRVGTTDPRSPSDAWGWAASSTIFEPDADGSAGRARNNSSKLRGPSVAVRAGIRSAGAAAACGAFAGRTADCGAATEVACGLGAFAGGTGFVAGRALAAAAPGAGADAVAAAEGIADAAGRNGEAGGASSRSSRSSNTAELAEVADGLGA